MPNDNDYDKLIEEQFRKLPKIVQQAIVSTDVQAQLRELADKHKLHLDQWGNLEDQVQMTLLGIEDTDDLVQNLEKQVGVDHDTALALGQDISKIVFEPIRQELERQLEHPAAVAVEKTGVEQMRDEILAREDAHGEVSLATPAAPLAAVPSTPPVAPATPPNTAPQVTVERTSAAPGYTPAVPSHERKGIEGDPYREPIL